MRVNDFWESVTALLAIATLVVAVRQWFISNDTLRLELFEKRYRVYAAAKLFLGLTTETPAFSQIDLNTFQRDTADAQFLFGAEVASYLKEVNDKQARLLSIRNRLAQHPNLPALDQDGTAPPDQAERDALEDERLAKNTWVGDQLTKGVLAAVFSPYLRFPDKAPGRGGVVLINVVLALVVLGVGYYLGVRSQPTASAPAISNETQQKLPTPPPAGPGTLPADNKAKAPAGGAGDAAARPAQQPGADQTAKP
jgi:hypothetical protein